jgi:integrase
VPRYRPVQGFRRPLRDADHAREAASPLAGAPGLAQCPAGAQALDQLAPQPAAALYVKAAVDGLVAHAHARIVRKQQNEPPADLLGAVFGMQPILHVFTQPAVEHEPAWLRAVGTLICEGLSHRRPVTGFCGGQSPGATPGLPSQANDPARARLHAPLTRCGAAGDLLPFPKGQAPLACDGLAGRDPARWGPWAVRCPVSASDVSHKKDRSRRKSRMHQRTRERLPVLPALIAWVDAERTRTAALLAAAEATRPGEPFTSAAGQTLRRSVMSTQATGRIWAEPVGGGPRQDLTFEEHRGFWTWAMVEVLRHTGIRIEELTELSHHSLIQYRLPGTAELIPLLQIAPSKTDAERLLVISPELADVLSTIVARARAGQPQVPPVVSYDKNERVYNPPMPLLFQWRRRLENRPVTETVLRSYLDHALTALGVKDTAGRPMRYTFHDFRRLFITDAIMHGMPPHIAQLVAGHRDINTTMGYKAVYLDEVIAGHRAFIARRRALRPGEEYRTPTDEEWDQFIGHFERRKVSVGDCGRSYDTPCIHEHSCLRCPLLRPDPAARDRLAQIRDNLIARIAEAEEHRWLGEAEGLKVSLAGAGAKLAQMDQISARRSQAVQLGIPAFTHAAGRASTAHPNAPEHG